MALDSVAVADVQLVVCGHLPWQKAFETRRGLGHVVGLRKRDLEERLQFGGARMCDRLELVAVLDYIEANGLGE
jgi:hypothetical protein